MFLMKFFKSTLIFFDVNSIFTESATFFADSLSQLELVKLIKIRDDDQNDDKRYCLTYFGLIAPIGEHQI